MRGNHQFRLHTREEIHAYQPETGSIPPVLGRLYVKLGHPFGSGYEIIEVNSASYVSDTLASNWMKECLKNTGMENVKIGDKICQKRN